MTIYYGLISLILVLFGAVAFEIGEKGMVLAIVVLSSFIGALILSIIGLFTGQPYQRTAAGKFLCIISIIGSGFYLFLIAGAYFVHSILTTLTR